MFQKIALALALAGVVFHLPDLAIAADAAAPAAPSAPVVFFDIAGPDAAKLRSFYGTAFGWKIGPTNRIGRDSTGSLDGDLRQDPPQKILYLGVPDVTAALKTVVEAGGAVVRPRFEVPGVVVLVARFN